MPSAQGYADIGKTLFGAALVHASVRAAMALAHMSASQTYTAPNFWRTGGDLGIC